ncbi:MAG: MazG nucleotide pyrophosphohydrolase domain-containing protein [Bacillota bacterium]|nr:MazG nucleotide pyrophosphohydrolase domain-containing protein [Bacillota bacterium]
MSINKTLDNHRGIILDNLISNVEKWGKETRKEEVYEVLEKTNKNVKMEFGDVMVTMIIMAKQLDIDLAECLEMAYEKIKDRKGKTINGTFVKEADL